jgi:hypothetical protein
MLRLHGHEFADLPTSSYYQIFEVGAEENIRDSVAYVLTAEVPVARRVTFPPPPVAYEPRPRGPW